jgi:hypothetical protein
MNDMVERVARAITPYAWNDSYWKIDGRSSKGQGWAKANALASARAAITAMREPTPGMIDAADAERFGMSGVTENSLVAVYEQMIEAALRP